MESYKTTLKWWKKMKNNMESEFTYKSFLAFTAHITQDLEAKPSPVKKAWERAHNTVTSQPSPHLSKVWEREHTWHSDLTAKPSPVKGVRESTRDSATSRPSPHLSKVWERAHMTQKFFSSVVRCWVTASDSSSISFTWRIFSSNCFTLKHHDTSDYHSPSDRSLKQQWQVTEQEWLIIIMINNTSFFL